MEAPSTGTQGPAAPTASGGPSRPSGDAPLLKHDYSSLVGRCAEMMSVLRLIDRATDVDVPVLLQGESGTGKELVARCLHVNGPRRDGPFVAVNCAAIPESLLESELFGHSRGAFTGAHRERTGVFVKAHRGTLFLDEIGDMSAAMQAKLLRVLQDREVHPLGGGEPRLVDVRLVCATNRHLPRLVQEGRFREDLYYRINVVRIEMPPLRRRLADLPDLCRHFLVTSGKELSTPAMERILRHSWPGNIRELSNVLERASVLAAGETLNVEHLDLPGPGAPDSSAPVDSLERHLERATRAHLLEVLRRSGWNRRRTALILGIDRTTLYRLMKKHAIPGTDSGVAAS